MTIETNMSEMKERRNHRGTTPAEAVSLQLRHVAEVLELDAIVLADEMGSRVAHAGDATAARMLADGAMFSAYGKDSIDEITLESLKERYPGVRSYHVVSHRLQISGQNESFMVFALGRSAGRAVGLQHAVQGITRICEKSFPGQPLTRF